MYHPIKHRIKLAFVACSLISMASANEPINLANVITELSQEQASASANNIAEVDDSVKNAIDSVIQRMNGADWQREQNELKSTIASMTGTVISSFDEEDGALKTQDRLILFVSSSVPVATLRHYAKDLEEIGGVMVMRGMIGGMKTIGPTLDFISKVLKVDPYCQGAVCPTRTTNFVIDPVLFTEHDIQVVPSMVFVQDMPLEPYCERFENDSIPSKQRYMVTGDASIEHMANELLRLSSDSALKEHMKAMQ